MFEVFHNILINLKDTKEEDHNPLTCDHIALYPLLHLPPRQYPPIVLMQCLPPLPTQRPTLGSKFSLDCPLTRTSGTGSRVPEHRHQLGDQPREPE